MRRMKLGTKIIGMAAALIFLMIVASGFGMLQLGKIGKEIKNIAEDDIPITERITEIAAGQLEQAVWLERALRYGEVLAEKEVAQKGLQSAEEHFASLTKKIATQLQDAERLVMHAIDNAATDQDRTKFEKIGQAMNDIAKHHLAYEEHVRQAFSLIHAGDLHGAEKLAEQIEHEEDELNQELAGVVKEIQLFTQEAARKAEHDEQAGLTGLAILAVLSFIFGALASFFVTRSITRPINMAIEQLNQGADQVAAASGQVSSASQQLAEGASEQAAGLEETSSSLEEMTAMTRQNADNTGHANTLVKETNQVVERANNSMVELTAAMAEISTASENTFKIIKTIDEIAFQTNLLALNAAVEAARAGEAGAGFAVVADEVRSLAMRAADAAKDTAELIEGTVKKVQDGNALLHVTNEAFGGISEKSVKVGQLIGEISAATSDQSNGISQINNAVTEMDRVVQENAASAEESASASEELNAQAESMKETVNELVALVEGAGRGGRTKDSRLLHRPRLRKSTRAVVPQPPQKAYAAGSPGTAAEPKAPRPENVIPLDNDEFEDF